MVRYTSIEEVNTALVELEEHDRIVSADKASGEKHSDNEKPSSRTISTITVVGNGQSIDNGTEENGVQDDVNDSETDSGSDIIDVEGHDDEELDEENHDDGCETEDDDDDDDDGPGPASDEEDEVHVRQKVTEVDPLEEADFDQELKAVVQASICIIYCMCCSFYISAKVYASFMNFILFFQEFDCYTIMIKKN